MNTYVRTYMHYCIAGNFHWMKFLRISQLASHPRIRHNCDLVLHGKPASVKILARNFHFWSHLQKFCPAKISHYTYIWYLAYCRRMYVQCSVWDLPC